MDAQAILTVLHQRGATIRLVGDQGIEVGPRRVLDDGLREEIRARKAQLVAELRRAEASDLARDPILETRHALGAVRLETRFGSIWIALDPSMTAELRVTEQARKSPRPVLEPSDVARLRGKSDGAIRAVLNAMAVFPGSAVIQ